MEKTPTAEQTAKMFWSTPLICFLDVLGFSELVKNNKHDELLDIYRIFLQNPVDIMNQYAKGDLEIFKKTFGEDYKGTNIKIVNVSDSILIWTEDSKEQTLIELLFVVKTILAVTLEYGIPLRGAISKGPISMIESGGTISILGRGLVSAYEQEKNQKWAGCIMSKGIIEFIRSFYKVAMQRSETSRVELLTSLIVEYDVPIKESRVKHFAINWADNLTLTDEQIEQSFSMFKKREKETELIKSSTELKIKNTTEFYHYCKSLKKSK